MENANAGANAQPSDVDATTTAAAPAPAHPPQTITLTALLHPELRTLFDRRGDERFDDDREYLRSLEADIEILGLGGDTRENFPRAIFQGEAGTAAQGVAASIKELAFAALA